MANAKIISIIDAESRGQASYFTEITSQLEARLEAERQATASLLQAVRVLGERVTRLEERGGPVISG